MEETDEFCEDMLALECVCIDTDELVQPHHRPLITAKEENIWIITPDYESNEVVCDVSPKLNLLARDGSVLPKSSVISAEIKTEVHLEKKLQYINNTLCQSPRLISNGMKSGDVGISQDSLILCIKPENNDDLFDANILNGIALENQSIGTLPVDLKVKDSFLPLHDDVTMERFSVPINVGHLHIQTPYLPSKMSYFSSPITSDFPNQSTDFPNHSPDFPNQTPDQTTDIPTPIRSFQVISRKLPSNKNRILCEICGLSFALANTLKNHFNTVHLQFQQEVTHRAVNCDYAEYEEEENNTRLNMGAGLLTDEAGEQDDSYEAYNDAIYDILGVETNNGHFEVRKNVKKRRHSSSDCAASVTTSAYEPVDKSQQFLSAQCAATFNSAASLKAHIVAQHSDRPSYLCGDCGKNYTSPATLNTHILMVHNHHRCVCEVCGKYYASKYYLKLHRKIHTETKDYTCSFCEKGFIDQQALRLHLRTHTGDRPFSCSNCGRGFTQSSHLKTHLRTHTGEKPYKCSVCGKHFRQQSNVMEHERTHRK